MEALKEKIFTRESAIRHLIMVGIMILIIGGSLLALGALGATWEDSYFGGIEQYDLEAISVLIGLVGGVLLVSMLMSLAIYWNARIWMLPCLIKAVLHLIGAIPIVNLLIPDGLRSSWFGHIESMAEPAYDGYWSYDPDWGWEYDDGSLPFFIAIPLGIITAVLKGVLACLGNLLAAIGIPLLTPVVLLLTLGGMGALGEYSPVLLLLAGLVFIAITVFVCIIHPIISFRRK